MEGAPSSGLTIGCGEEDFVAEGVALIKTYKLEIFFELVLRGLYLTTRDPVNMRQLLLVCFVRSAVFSLHERP